MKESLNAADQAAADYNDAMDAATYAKMEAAEATENANVAARKEAVATSEYEKLTGEKPE